MLHGTQHSSPQPGQGAPQGTLPPQWTLPCPPPATGSARACVLPPGVALASLQTPKHLPKWPWVPGELLVAGEGHREEAGMHSWAVLKTMLKSPSGGKEGQSSGPRQEAGSRVLGHQRAEDKHSK